MRLLSIGEFSRVTGLPVKTLRYYHERKLLQPARVEAGSGYRYYDDQNLETAKIIVALRQLEFSLDDIQSLLEDSDGENLISFLEKRKDEVQQRIQSQRSILARLDQVISAERANLHRWDEQDFEIEQRGLESILIGGLRMTGRYSDVGKGFGRLGRSLGRHIGGPAMCLYFDQEYREEDADFEPCFPIRREIKADGLSIRELEGGNAVCLKHQGPYDTLGQSYAKLFDYVNEHELKVARPSREVYLKGPGVFFRGNPAKYVTEIQLLVS